MWVENYRCFRERQTADLAPLTLLVGDNGTGKTSFLAMARLLADLFEGRPADFNAPPFDLGDFDDIAHDRGRGGRAKSFMAGIRVPWREPATKAPAELIFETTFGRSGASPAVERTSLNWKTGWLTLDHAAQELQFGESNRAWRWPFANTNSVRDAGTFAAPWFAPLERWRLQQGECRGIKHDDKPSRRLIGELVALTERKPQRQPAAGPAARPRPQRTYDPGDLAAIGDENDAAMILADASLRRPKQWEPLRCALEAFGRQSGLFDEITVRTSGKSPNEPFQLCLRKTAKRRKGPHRNLIDVGFGVSQILPVLMDLLGADAPDLHFIQHPEAYLHPSAHAALGSLLCELAASGRQLLVETHSDHLMKRVLLDVRDRATKLKPEDVSFVYFERGDLDVRLHSIWTDDMGNVLGAPAGYRQFFMKEVTRSLGL